MRYQTSLHNDAVVPVVSSSTSAAIPAAASSSPNVATSSRRRHPSAGRPHAINYTPWDEKKRAQQRVYAKKYYMRKKQLGAGHRAHLTPDQNIHHVPDYIALLPPTSWQGQRKKMLGISGKTRIPPYAQRLPWSVLEKIKLLRDGDSNLSLRRAVATAVCEWEEEQKIVNATPETSRRHPSFTPPIDVAATITTPSNSNSNERVTQLRAHLRKVAEIKNQRRWARAILYSRTNSLLDLPESSLSRERQQSNDTARRWIAIPEDPPRSDTFTIDLNSPPASARSKGLDLNSTPPTSASDGGER